jgi:hypothetical protein
MPAHSITSPALPTRRNGSWERQRRMAFAVLINTDGFSALKLDKRVYVVGHEIVNNESVNPQRNLAIQVVKLT